MYLPVTYSLEVAIFYICRGVFGARLELALRSCWMDDEKLTGVVMPAAWEWCKKSISGKRPSQLLSGFHTR
jgi:hypothetical protein